MELQRCFFHLPEEKYNRAKKKSSFQREEEKERYASISITFVQRPVYNFPGIFEISGSQVETNDAMNLRSRGRGGWLVRREEH